MTSVVCVLMHVFLCVEFPVERWELCGQVTEGIAHG
jgi:hypothetical protein